MAILCLLLLLLFFVALAGVLSCWPSAPSRIYTYPLCFLFATGVPDAGGVPAFVELLAIAGGVPFLLLLALAFFLVVLIAVGTGVTASCERGALLVLLALATFKGAFFVVVLVLLGTLEDFSPKLLAFGPFFPNCARGQ